MTDNYRYYRVKVSIGADGSRRVSLVLLRVAGECTTATREMTITKTDLPAIIKELFRLMKDELTRYEEASVHYILDGMHQLTSIGCWRHHKLFTCGIDHNIVTAAIGAKFLEVSEVFKQIAFYEWL